MVMPSGPDVIMSGVMMSGVMMSGVMISGAIISGRVADAVMGAVAGAVVGAAGEFWLALLVMICYRIVSEMTQWRFLSRYIRCGCGGTGRRAALRSLWANTPWKFESSQPHQIHQSIICHPIVFLEDSL